MNANINNDFCFISFFRKNRSIIIIITGNRMIIISKNIKLKVFFNGFSTYNDRNTINKKAVVILNIFSLFFIK